MRHKTKDVPPYEHTYRVFNKATKIYSNVFLELIDAVEYVMRNDDSKRGRLSWWWMENKISYVLHTEADIRRWAWNSDTIPAPLNVIVNDLGDVLTREEIKDSLVGYKWKDSSSRRKYIETNKMRMLRIKGSANKIKQSCEHIPYESRWGDGYTTRVLGYGKRVATMNEKKASEGHIDEYGDGIVRGSRRPRQLPDAWDDKPIAMWDTMYSWKHNSKRRKQWISK